MQSIIIAQLQVKNELKTHLDHQKNLKSELRNLYQKQVDETVQTKLKEFQTQLDAAELSFQNEVELKTRAVAENAARKMKALTDKYCR